MGAVVALAEEIIEGLRRARRLRGRGAFIERGAAPPAPAFTASEAQLAMLFGAARSLRLGGVSRENFLLVAGAFYDLSADGPAPTDAEKGTEP